MKIFFGACLTIVMTLTMCPQGWAADNVWDVVIVGGGISGLSAAFQLNDYRVLILEKENQLGGRIKTLNRDGINFDVGAPFNLAISVLPFRLSSQRLIRPVGPGGVYYRGKLKLGQSLKEVLSGLDFSPSETDKILRFQRGEIGIDALDARSYEFVNGCFKAFSSGEIKDYMPEFQKMFFVDYSSEYFYSEGLYSLVSEYRKRIKAEIRTNSLVLSVEDKKNLVEITYQDKNAEIKTIRAKAVIVATPGIIANQIIRRKNSANRYFLDSLRYAEYTVVALGIKAGVLDKFSYIFTPDMPFDVVWQMRDDVTKRNILMVYFGDRGSRENNDIGTSQLISKVLQGVNRLGIGTISAADILFSEVQRWPYACTVISSQSYGHWKESYLLPSDRVFLAGDYVYPDFPYGLSGAVISGQKSADLAKSILTSPWIIRARNFRARIR